MKSTEYWKKRFNIIEEAKAKAGFETIAEVEKIFILAQKELESKILVWYGRFAKNNSISFAEAKRLLKTNELEEFRWDVNEYIRHGEQVGMNPKWIKQLENASARFHVTRFEALQLQIQHTMEKLFGNQLDIVDKLMKKQYLDGYYHTCYEIQKGFNIGWDIAAINEGTLEKIILKPWTNDNKTFSSRIWQDKDRLLNQLHTELARNMILGKAPHSSIDNLAKAMGTSKQNAGRLIMTESAYFSNAAQYDVFKELDVERFEVVETLDSVTCKVCGELDGKVVPMSDYQAGITAPPFHPWCRGCTVPYFDDDVGKRIARGADGKTYHVPSNMKYEEWKEKYVLDAANEKDKTDFEKYKDILGNNSPKSLEAYLKIRYNNNDWEQFKSYTSSIKSGELTALADFELYKKANKEIDEILVGKTTANNIVITGKSKHYISRTIGSINHRRNGVSAEDALDTLLNPTEITEVKTLSNGSSQVFRKDGVAVSVNPDTGLLIQVNPYKKIRK